MVRSNIWSRYSRQSSKIGETGMLNLLMIPLILLLIVLIGVSVFAYSAYAQAQDYKNNVAEKVDVAVSAAREEIGLQKDKDFAEKEKFPYDTYTGPEAAGSIRIQYPKTWSAYTVAATNSSSKPLEAWFQPNQVPSIADPNNSFALRVTVAQQSYESIMRGFQGRQKTGKVSIQPYQSANVPGIIGSRIDGEIDTRKQGAMIVMPFRDKTLQMWTESDALKGDFNEIILKNFSFTP